MKKTLICLMFIAQSAFGSSNHPEKKAPAPAGTKVVQEQSSLFCADLDTAIKNCAQTGNTSRAKLVMMNSQANFPTIVATIETLQTAQQTANGTSDIIATQKRANRRLQQILYFGLPATFAVGCATTYLIMTRNK